ncbi:MAG: hypothetical protein WDN31_16325 [Hyphomicrobium sp.]
MMQASPAAEPQAPAPSAPIKIAVLAFELRDMSAGGGIIAQGRDRYGEPGEIDGGGAQDAGAVGPLQGR